MFVLHIKRKILEITIKRFRVNIFSRTFANLKIKSFFKNILFALSILPM